MAQGDLVSLAQVKAYLGVQSTADDILLASMISQVSRAICTYLNRPFIWPRNVVDTFDGNGRTRIQLRHWPVVSVTSVSINGQNVPAASGPMANGWLLEPGDEEPPGAMQMLILRGGAFMRGWQNVSISYRAGYQVSAEAAVVPASPALVAAQQPYGAFAVDCGVSYANCQPLTPVAASPLVGQFAVDAFGNYTFAAGDVGQNVLLNYGYAPIDLSACALEWVAERYRYRERVGMNSKSLGGQETAAFRITAMPEFVVQSLRSFARIIAN